MKTQSKFYNSSTKFYYKILKHPIFLKKSLEIPRKNPNLTVIFLHGISADSTTWQKTFNRLEKNKNLTTVRFLSLDLLGFGKSLKADWQKYNFSEFDAALKNSLKRYRVKTPYIIVGHSMGCLVTVHFAKNSPKNLEELILISPPVIKRNEIAKLPDKFYTKTYSSIEKIADKDEAKALGSFIERASSFRSSYLDTKAFNSTMKNLILSPTNYDTFLNLNLKTTIIHGRLDPLVIGKNLAELANENPFLKLIPTMSTHDISKQKYDKMVSILERAIKNVKTL